MPTGGNGPPGPAVSPKGAFPLGPFPRHIWIHHNTPQDSLDKACHDIWKRVQGLSEDLQPSSPLFLQPTCPPEPSETLRASQESLEQNCVKDEISLLVEQEYLSLTQETTNETEMQGSEEGKKTDFTLSQTASNSSLIPPSNRDQLLDETEGVESVYKAMIGSKERERKLRALCDAQLSTKATIAESSRPAKCSGKNSKGVDNGITNIEASNLEISKLLVQFPVKHTETSKAPDKQLVAEKAKLVKDFLQNSKLSSLGQKESAPATLLTTTTTESQAPGQKKQLLGLSKICPKTNPDLVTEVLQTPVTTAPSDKNSFKYSGNIFAPRFPTNSTTATLNHPFWLNLNFPPPPVFPNHSGFPQFQGLYHQRVRMPYQQTIHPSLGCYSRQVTPYNPQHLFRSPYTPLLNYVPLVHPNYSYQQRNLLKPSSNVRDPPAMAGDGPQYQFPHLYGFNSMLGGSLRTNPYFSSMSGINF
ncbi:PREDICTED: uncharacterized protein C1orf94 homolog [Crocodylus porosus]|uniref:uncharacterized protein C1orf94 homolog n=1 Tax=Crocodylus porosus TaxID=8502 RepID=UPI00093B0382|nr:PREDICTED: uncharacterized protein C1orf94 homolog [Crocodylus porosus]